jgi:hypothetical protein
MAQTNPRGRNPAVWVAVSILIIVGIAGTLWVPLYARTTPKLGDFPFFYWYQLIWVPAVAILSLLAYLLLRTGTRPAGAGAGQAPGSASSAREVQR